ncbi:MAG TPA: sensor histidine kinase [Spirochaetota bacterium]|nr:sensor histidine kinase [Spirochaetota bacterium]HPI88982.1 sensor histidine kinase [Spirochaetota bacterium]HPR47469.1 sensor histidine kinase [Spirochaetota bacterium]
MKNLIINTTRQFKIELLLTALFALALFLLFEYVNAFEYLYQFSRSHEAWQLDEIFSVLIFFVLASVIIIHRRMRELLKMNKTIENLLNEKELILSEVHHRIKNNMNVIKSILSLQSQSLGDPRADIAFQDAITRIESMSVLYDKLYRKGEYKVISTREYLTSLIDEIYNVNVHHKPVTIEKQIDDFSISIDLLFPVGIIINELLTNAFKHAFIDRTNGTIHICVTRKAGIVIIIFSDNGIGMPDAASGTLQKGLGITLIELLTQQIDGSYTIERNNGTSFTFTFDLFKSA